MFFVFWLKAFIKADFQSVEFSERAEIVLFAGENVTLKFNRMLRLSNFSLSKSLPARKIPLTGNWALEPCIRIFFHSALADTVINVYH